VRNNLKYSTGRTFLAIAIASLFFVIPQGEAFASTFYSSGDSMGTLELKQTGSCCSGADNYRFWGHFYPEIPQTTYFNMVRFQASTTESTLTIGYQIYSDSNGNIDFFTDGYYSDDPSSGDTPVGSFVQVTATKSGDIRNDIYINYGNNFGSQKTASNATSIATYGYKAETINSFIHDATNAQEVADRYIAQRAFPQAVFDTITFPLTNSEIDDADRDALLGIFMGQPIYIANLPTQISGGQFEGYVEGWSWSSSYNQLLLTINLSPVAFSQVAMRWNSVPITEAWNTLDNTLTWEYATIVA